MIKIKRKEFVKFLQNINEMRSSYSRSMIDNEGEEDNTPIDATQEMGALQLSTSLPDVSDEDFVPASNKQLRDAMIKISKEVPDSQLENFYRNILKLFDKTIDQMPEAENPFNPVTESVLRTLMESIEDENEEEDETDQFDYDTSGRGVYIDLSNVPGSDELINFMNSEARSSDSGHVDTTVHEISACVSTEVFKRLVQSNDQFRQRFEEEADDQIIDGAFESFEDQETLDPETQVSYALENLNSSLQKAFMLAKLTVLEKIFKTDNQDKKLSVDVMSNLNDIRNILQYDKIIPAPLHELAIVASYFTNTLTKQETNTMLRDGLYELLGDTGYTSFGRTYGRKYQREIESGQLEVFLPKETKVDLTAFQDYGEFDEDSKTFKVDPAVRGYFNYVQLVKGGQKEDIGKAAAFLYYTVARLSYYIDKKRKAEAPSAPAQQVSPSGRRRVRVQSGQIFRGDLTKVDVNSNIVKEIIETAVRSFMATLPEKQNITEFLSDMQTFIEDESGNITQDRSIKNAEEILKKSQKGMNLSGLSKEESTMYSNSYYQMHDILRAAKLKIEASFSETGKPIYDPKTNPYDWPFLSDTDKVHVNSRLEGIDQEVVDFVFRYTSHMIGSGEETFKVLNRSSSETGGNYVILVPIVTFAYLVPFILSNSWQKTLMDHWERYKPGQRRIAPVSTESEVRKIEKYFERREAQWGEVAPFLGYTNASGAKQFFEQNVSHRFLFMQRHFQNFQTESGGPRVNVLETLYDRVVPVFTEALEKYVTLIDRAASDTSLSQEESEYWSDLRELYTEYLSQMQELNNIIVDFNIFDYDAMDSQDWIFDDENEEIPTDISAKLGDLLKNTVPGMAIRSLAHDISIKNPNKNASYMPDFSKHIENIAVIIMVADESLSLNGATTPRARTMNANIVKEYFSGKKVIPDYDKGGSRAENLIKYGFTQEKIMEFVALVSKVIDKLFARAFQSEKMSDVSFSEFGEKVEAYVEKNIPKSWIRKMVDERLDSLEAAMNDFNNPSNMERMTNIIDNYFVEAYDETRIKTLYLKYMEIKDQVLEENRGTIESIKEMDDFKKKEREMEKLKKVIHREIEKRRAPIKKEALAIRKEMDKRKSTNAKAQGNLL